MSNPVDPDALAEAVENQNAVWRVLIDHDDGPEATVEADLVLYALVEAARAFLEAPTADWCETHRSVLPDRHPESPICCWFIMFVLKGTNADWENPPNHLPCKFGRVRLVAESQPEQPT